MKIASLLATSLRFLNVLGDEVEKQYDELFKTGEYYNYQREKIMNLNVRWIGRNTQKND